MRLVSLNKVWPVLSQICDYRPLSVKAWAEKHTSGHALAYLKYVIIASFDPCQL